MTPLGDNCAERVKDDESAHRQRENTEHVKDDARHLHRAGKFRAARQSAERERVPQLRLDRVHDGFGFRFILCRQICFDDVDASGRIKQFLRLGECDEYLFVAGERAPRHQTNNRQFDDALGRWQLDRIVQFHADGIGEPFRNHGDVAIAGFQKASLRDAIIVQVRRNRRIDADE